MKFFQKDKYLASAGPSAFVWTFWFLMTFMMLGFLILFTCPLPYVDAWIVAADASGPECSWQWLWEQQNEHRYPLVKALAWISYHTFGSMEPLSFLSVLACSAASAGLILTARRLRGHTEWTDAVFPLLLLNGFHIENILWHHQLFFVAAGCLACACGTYLMRKPEEHRAPGAFFAGIGLLLLPLHGLMGMAFAPFLGLGYFLHGIAVLRRNRRSTAAWLNTVMPFLTAGVCILYLAVDFHIPGGHAGNFSAGISLAAKFRTILECASVGLGALGNRIPKQTGEGLFLLSVLTVFVLAVVWRKRCISRFELVSLLLVLASGWMLPFAVGCGRSAMGGAAPRYAILSAPLAAFLVLLWIRIAACVPKKDTVSSQEMRMNSEQNSVSPLFFLSTELSRLIQYGFFTVFCAFLMYHVSMAMEYGKERLEQYDSFCASVRVGLPLEAVSGKHWSYWGWDEDDFTYYIKRMAANGVKPFAEIPEAGLRETEEIPLETHTFEGAYGTEIPLRIPGGKHHIDALRLTFELHSDAWRSDTAVYWDSGSFVHPHAQRNGIKTGTGRREKQLTVWVDADIDGVIFVPESEENYKLNLKKAVILSRP